MTGGGAPGAAGILKCLHQEASFRIVAADANSNAIARYLNADFVTIPPATEAGFADSIMDVCRNEGIHVVMPLVTRELIPLANSLTKFAGEGVRILVSPPESLSIANNKSALYQFLQWRGIEVPEFRVVENINLFDTALTDLGYPEKEVCFKPSLSNGSRGFRIVSNKFSSSNLLFNQKPDNTYVSRSWAMEVLASAPFPELLVSEYLPGQEYSVDCLANQGNPVLVVPRLRKKMIQGISVEGEFEQNEKIIDYCNGIIRALKLHGNIGIQLKTASSGAILILEINPRLQGTVAAALGAGINFPALAVKQELELPILPEELFVKWGTRFSRYWTEVFH